MAVDFEIHDLTSLACPLWAFLAFLDPVAQKKAKFGRNLLLCHFPAFSSLSPQLSLLPSQPNFPKQLLGKMGEYERFYIVKKGQLISVSHSGPYKKDGLLLLLKDNWGLSEKNAGKWQSSRFLQDDGFFGPQGPSRQARLMFETIEKSNIWANYTSLQHVEWSKSSLMNLTLPFCMDFFYLHPFIL